MCALFHAVCSLVPLFSRDPLVDIRWAMEECSAFHLTRAQEAHHRDIHQRHLVQVQHRPRSVTLHVCLQCFKVLRVRVLLSRCMTTGAAPAPGRTRARATRAPPVPAGGRRSVRPGIATAPCAPIMTAFYRARGPGSGRGLRLFRRFLRTCGSVAA
jgi:hypothetical protein